MRRIILRGGPFTGEIHEVHEASTTFRVPGANRTYEATGQADLETGLPIFIYNLPTSARPRREPPSRLTGESLPWMSVKASLPPRSRGQERGGR